MNLRFMESEHGVCLMHPIVGDATLCGDSFDIGEDLPNDVDFHLMETKKHTVTCLNCINIIKHCKKARLADSK